jgi:hypothetical protein
LAYAIVHIIADSVVVLVCRTIAATLPERVELIAFTIARSLRNVIAAARVNFTWTIAHATRIELAYAIVHIIADSVVVLVCRTIAATLPERVELIAFTIARSRGNVVTAASIDGTRAVAHATCIKLADAVIDGVTDPVAIRVFETIATANAERIDLISIAVTVFFRDVGTTALENCSRSIADAASVK